jgi:frataxin-like iron-binding protein CyaY
MGNLVTFQMEFINGLVYGTNLNTGLSGIFPKNVIWKNKSGKELWRVLRDNLRSAEEKC